MNPKASDGERDEEAARKFAVEWSTKSRGKIANLAGCYLRALQELKDLKLTATKEAIAVCEQVVEEYAAGDLRIRDWTAHEVARRLNDRLRGKP